MTLMWRSCVPCRAILHPILVSLAEQKKTQSTLDRARQDSSMERQHAAIATRQRRRALCKAIMLNQPEQGRTRPTRSQVQRVDVMAQQRAMIVMRRKHPRGGLIALPGVVLQLGCKLWSSALRCSPHAVNRRCVRPHAVRPRHARRRGERCVDLAPQHPGTRISR